MQSPLPGVRPSIFLKKESHSVIWLSVNEKRLRTSVSNRVQLQSMTCVARCPDRACPAHSSSALVLCANYFHDG